MKIIKIIPLTILFLFSFNSLQAGWFGKSEEEKFDEAIIKSINDVSKTLPKKINRYTTAHSAMYHDKTVFYVFIVSDDFVINKQTSIKKLQTGFCAEKAISLFKKYGVKRVYYYNNKSGNLIFKATVYAKNC